jgi:hypothetical protein
MMRLTLPLSLLALQQQVNSFSFVPTGSRNALHTEFKVPTSSSSELRMQAADADRPIVKSVLDRVNTPSDMKGLDLRELKQVRTKTFFCWRRCATF